jgi:hypothetical protein
MCRSNVLTTVNLHLFDSACTTTVNTVVPTDSSTVIFFFRLVICQATRCCWIAQLWRGKHWDDDGTSNDIEYIPWFPAMSLPDPWISARKPATTRLPEKKSHGWGYNEPNPHFLLNSRMMERVNNASLHICRPGRVITVKVKRRRSNVLEQGMSMCRIAWSLK